MKTCSGCGESKDSSEFGADRKRPDGLKVWCRKCSREYSREFACTPKQQAKRRSYYEANKEKLRREAKERWATNREAYEPARKRWAAENAERMQEHSRQRGADYRAWIGSLKEGRPCQDCGGTFAPYVMEYDHVRGEKRHNIGKMTNHKRERVLEEIAKCELVCCACHRIRSHSRREPPKTPKLIAYREWLVPLKSKPCRDCGKTLAPEAMDFDHVRGEKVRGITEMWSYSRDKVLVELEKCDLVCANCHRERTWQRLHGAPKDARPLACVSCGETVWGYSGKAGNVKCEGCRKTPVKHRKGSDTKDLVACRLCGIQRRQLGQHIKKAHGLAVTEYRERFPGALVEVPGSRTRSAECRAKQSAAAKKRWADPEERAAQSERLKESAPWKGKKFSLEHCTAISRGLLSSDKRVGRPPTEPEVEEALTVLEMFAP